jgi:hypothetical protein
MRSELPSRRIAGAARRCLAGVVAIAGLAWGGGEAWAYRPFDGTDAAVADVGELEIELQPGGLQREGGEKSFIGPDTVLNVGIAKNWELVLQGRWETPLTSPDPPLFANAGALLKHVLKEGALQDKAGASVATEFGVLLPDADAPQGYGASVAGIVSQRWDWGTAHLNMQGELTRDHNADLFLGTILEGPAKWTVRPVAEVFYENEFGVSQTVSALVGAIWQVRDNLAFDIGLRHAITDGRPIDEIRVGLTVGIPLRLSEPHAR